MNSLFGKAKAQPSAKDSIVQLRETLGMLEKRQAHLEKKVESEVATARAKAKTNRKQALMALKRKKVYENQIDQIQGTMLTIETQVMAIENANVNMEAMKAMKAGGQALKGIHQNINIDNVDDVMEDMREQMDIAAEIGEAISQPVGMGLDIDDDELDEELDLLEQQMLDDELINVEPTPTMLPSTPNATLTPTTAMPSAPTAVAETDEERELRELELSMAM